MKKCEKMVLTIIVFVIIITMLSCSQQVPAEKSETKVTRRVGMVVGIDPEKIEEYKTLHADSNPGVRDLLTKYHIHNFSIFLQEIDGKWYEFGYYEYIGDDYEGDMARLAAEPRNKEWLKVCDPMQIPLPGAQGWTEMERVYFNQ